MRTDQIRAIMTGTGGETMDWIAAMQKAICYIEAHLLEDVNYEDVMAIIDEAVVNLEKRNMKNLFMTVLDNAYTEASMCTLIPEDVN